MKDVAKYKMPTAYAVAREKARRHFASAADVRAEARKFVLDPADIALDEAVQCLTADPGEQEAHIALVGALAADLARGSDDPTVLMWCRVVAQSRFYSCLSDIKLHQNIRNTVDHRTNGFKGLTDYQSKMALAYTRAVRSLADVTRVDVSEIEARISRYRVVG
jgi:hypothetical protein